MQASDSAGFDVPERLRPVLALVVRGRRNREIAAELGYAQSTVESYVSELVTLFGCESRTSLAIRVRDSQYVD